MKLSSRPLRDPNKAPADEILEILFQETPAGDVVVSMPNGEILMLEPDVEDAGPGSGAQKRSTEQR
jgi:hypothetical protein